MPNDEPADMPPEGSQPASSGPDWNEAKAKLTGATGADRMILIAGLVFFVASFLPWWSVSLFGIKATVSGWNYGGLSLLAIIFAMGATAFAVIRVLGVKLDLGSVNDGVVYLVLGGGAFVFALLRFLTGVGESGVGLWIAIVAGAALAYGGWQKFQASK